MQNEINYSDQQSETDCNIMFQVLHDMDNNSDVPVDQ